jgi:acyl-CoA hydrolase
LKANTLIIIQSFSLLNTLVSTSEKVYGGENINYMKQVCGCTPSSCTRGPTVTVYFAQEKKVKGRAIPVTGSGGP